MRKFVAFLFALFLAIPMLIASLFLISIQSWAFDRDFYKSALAGDEVFDAVENAVVARIDDQFDMGGMKLDSGAFGKAVFTALPRSELRAAVQGMVDSGFDVLEGKVPPSEAMLDTEGLARSLEKKSGLLAKAYAEAVPEASSAAADASDLSVRPKGMSVDAFAAKIRPAVDKAVAEIAASLRREVKIGMSAEMARDLPFKGNIIKAVRVGFVVLLVGAVLVLILGALVWPRPWAGRFTYLGSVVLLSSLFVIAAGLASGAVLKLDGIIAGARMVGADLPAEFASAALSGYLADLVGRISRGFFITGIIAVSAGAGLLSLRWAAAAREL
jgi:hypothetical protein